MMYWLRVVGVLCLVLALVESQKYCNPSLCANGTRHIACNNNGTFTRDCPDGAFMVNLMPYRPLIINMHNNKRNQIAGGRINGYKQANRMATMQWDEDLTKMAAFNVKQCQMRHDACHNTQRFRQSGQNLAIKQYTGRRNRLTDESILRELINGWFNEYQNANMSYINKYPSNYTGEPIGHFTVMVANRNTHLGCKAARYTRGLTHNFLLACNYAITNIIGQPIYTSGKATFRCQNGRNPNYWNLCADGETY